MLGHPPDANQPLGCYAARMTEAGAMTIEPSLDVSADEIRQVLACRVRLKVTEERRWFFWRAFHVTGPQRVLDEVTMEIARMESAAWLERQW